MPRAFPNRGVLLDACRTLSSYALAVTLLVLPLVAATTTTQAISANPVPISEPAPVATSLPITSGRVSHRSFLLAVRPGVLRQLDRINDERAANGLSALRLQRCLTREAAQPWARRMASTGDFRHRELDAVRERCTRFGWVGENIAYGFPTVDDVMNAWMNSPGHRANLLHREFTHVGIGIKRDANGRKYWVQNFGG